jgi:urea transport system ATP-binding protein
VAYVPQGREIFPRLTVEENLLLGLSRFSAREAKQVPEEIWQLFPVLKEMKHRRGAISPVGSSSSWRLAARWRAVRSC